MSGTGLFVVGAVVTLIVAAALVLLLYAAILDGRDAASRRPGRDGQTYSPHGERAALVNPAPDEQAAPRA